jgi:hypothetical protein
MLRTTCAVAVTALVLAAVPAISATADVSPDISLRPRTGKVSLTMPADVVEGDRFTVEVKVGRVHDAKVVQLEQQVSVNGKLAWQTVGKTKAKKKKTYKFGAVAGKADTQTYRARVVYREGKPAKSAASASTVWHWKPLLAFTAYSHTTGANDNGLTAFNLNGVSFYGWFTTGSFKSWESRFTVGRHCQAIRGVAGVRDESADGSSAVVRLLADDVPVYTSPPLTPGTAQPFQVPLAMPYRLTVLAQNTSSPPPLTVYPALGSPELLCTGLAVT